MAGEWQCQYCNLRCELPEDAVQRSGATLLMENAAGPRVFFLTLTVCPNRNCRQLHAALAMYELKKDERGTLAPGPSPLKRWQLIPSTSARQLPDFVPEAVKKEYEQATGIKEISPDAAATMARRCLQNIVRDFWNVREKFLSEELDAVKEKIDPDTWRAIESVRQTGHIGRHMEKAINLVVDTEPDEPDVLLGLIEYLIDEWYVARRQRQERLNKFKGLRGQENAAPAPPAEGEPLSAPEPEEPASPADTLQRRPPASLPASSTRYFAASKPSPEPPVVSPKASTPIPSPLPPVIPLRHSAPNPAAPPLPSRRPPRFKDKDIE